MRQSTKVALALTEIMLLLTVAPLDARRTVAGKQAAAKLVHDVTNDADAPTCSMLKADFEALTKKAFSGMSNRDPDGSIPTSSAIFGASKMRQAVEAYAKANMRNCDWVRQTKDVEQSALFQLVGVGEEVSQCFAKARAILEDAIKEGDMTMMAHAMTMVFSETCEATHAKNALHAHRNDGVPGMDDMIAELDEVAEDAEEQLEDEQMVDRMLPSLLETASDSSNSNRTAASTFPAELLAVIAGAVIGAVALMLVVLLVCTIVVALVTAIVGLMVCMLLGVFYMLMGRPISECLDNFIDSDGGNSTIVTNGTQQCASDLLFRPRLNASVA